MLFHQADLVDEFISLPPKLYSGVEGADEHHHHIYNQFIIRAKKRDELRDYLQKNDIGCEIYYPLCLHQQQCLAGISDFADTGQSFPVAEKAASETLAIPIYPGLSHAQQEYVVETIHSFYHH
jgi:dTDP-4-amino-4,6-dideoxygalactose transaminase